MVRNGVKLYYPVVPMIKSILPLVDEFIIAVGKGDPDDTTRKDILSIGDPKIKIIDTVWDTDKYPRGMEHAHQTDIAKNACSGDWLFYLQSDEVVHEKDLPTIKEACEKYLNDTEVEGLLFNYLHFWGDYSHYQRGHGWYRKEIRIIRNRPDIHSWQSAQSFRRIPDFDGISYRKKSGTFKLKVAELNAHIYHYGWARPPRLMKNKRKAFDIIHKGKARAGELHDRLPSEFDYGPLLRLTEFKGSHPQVMKRTIENMDWKDKLQYSGSPDRRRQKHKHEKLKYRLLSFIENKLLGSRELFGFKNYIIIRK